ncbi:MAG: hypothetical protein LBT50_07165 [Prevotellaceae bacterium]|jgi:serine/threonine protein kinase|nr:hypothetical protein [Prevotellaceae bacterium]
MEDVGELKDYNVNITIPECIKDPVLSGGKYFPLPSNNTKPINYVGGYCVVYPYESRNGIKYAVRCWHAIVLDAQFKAEQIAKKLKEVKLPYFVEFEYVTNGIFATNKTLPIVRMAWVDAENIRNFVTKNITNKPILKRLLENFVDMVSDLHKHNISHGDLQHGNILIKPDGAIVLVDYDSMYIDELKNTKNEIAGLHGFQHPSRRTDTKPSPKADYFSELVIYITLMTVIEKPDIWFKYDCDKDSNDLIFKAEDFDDISKSTAYNEVCAISEDMTKLVVNLKKACQKTHFEELSPLENVLSDLGVRPPGDIDFSELLTTITETKTLPKMPKQEDIDFSSLLDMMKEEKKTNS